MYGHYRSSLATCLTQARNELGIGQIQMSKLLNLKVHRLSDLEKCRSCASPLEEERIRRELNRLLDPELLLKAG